MRKGKRKWVTWIEALLLFVFVILPLGIYAILCWGFPPVIGNLVAAPAMRQYAAQAHPDWEPQGIWAGYNLVDGCYYLTFSEGDETHLLNYDLSAKLVRDDLREEALQKELDVGQLIRANGLSADGMHTYCYVWWSSKEPDTPLLTLRTDFYVPAELDSAAVREHIADVGMQVYEALSPSLPIHKISIHCGQDPTEQHGLTWTTVTLTVDETDTLYRQQWLSAPATVKSFD